MERASQGAFKVCRTAAEVRDCLADGTIAAIMHMEGAEAIDESLDALHLFHAMGLRSLGPVWSRPTIFGHGVPFAFPSTPDTGPGLTDAGKRLVTECNGLQIMMDLSHMNEAGFNDVARLSDAPLVATHSNAHALCPSTPQPDRPATGDDPRQRRHGRAELRRLFPAPRRAPGRPKPAGSRSCARWITCSNSWAKIISASARISTAARRRT